MDCTKQQLLQQFLEGSCTGEDLKAVRQLLKEPGTDKLLDEIIHQYSSDERDSHFMDEFMIKRFQWKQQQQQMRLQGSETVYTPKGRAGFNSYFYRIAAIFSGVLLLTSFIILVILKLND